MPGLRGLVLRGEGLMPIFRWFIERRKRREMERAAAEYEEMRRISDNFGWGPILRYGEDRYGGGPDANSTHN